MKKMLRYWPAWQTDLEKIIDIIGIFILVNNERLCFKKIFETQSFSKNEEKSFQAFRGLFASGIFSPEKKRGRIKAIPTAGRGGSGQS